MDKQTYKSEHWPQGSTASNPSGTPSLETANLSVVCCIKRIKYLNQIISEHKLTICAFVHLYYYISRDKFEPEPGFGLEVRVLIPVQVQVFLLKINNKKYVSLDLT